MTPPPIDWSQLWYPGRKMPFTADELARAGRDGPSPTLIAVAGVTVGLLAFVILLLSPPGQTARLTGLLIGLAVVTFSIARRLWCNPWRRPLLLACLGFALGMWVVIGLLRWRIPDREERQAVVQVLVLCGTMVPMLLWFLTVWRAHQIEARLREQAERGQAIEMARRLAAAQIEPHFLFNTLASVQHWVQTKDDRAGPLLAALTGYLRATLPLFDRALLPAGDELEAVRRYLEVMQARMGERLAFTLDIPPELGRALVPPGLLLTLVENAIAHGLEPRLAGGHVRLRARREDAWAVFEVVDDGAGPAPDMRDGVGLGNARQRLALTCGPEASLNIAPAPGGGCRAVIRLPWREAPT